MPVCAVNNILPGRGAIPRSYLKIIELNSSVVRGEYISDDCLTDSPSLYVDPAESARMLQVFVTSISELSSRTATLSRRVPKVKVLVVVYEWSDHQRESQDVSQCHRHARCIRTYISGEGSTTTT